uniref:Uncharacterized protein n=1 Tax=Oryza nivara TaxID=4536 RepID=A0A0E0FIE0_ORYNI
MVARGNRSCAWPCGLGMAGGGQEGSGNRQGVGDGVPPDGGRDSEARRKTVTALSGYGSPRGCGVPRQWQSEHCESDKVEADPIEQIQRGFSIYRANTEGKGVVDGGFTCFAMGIGRVVSAGTAAASAGPIGSSQWRLRQQK